jgi:hypothetical protein
MPPDESVPPAEDWEFPPVDPADDLIGWTPEPALPEPDAVQPAAVDPRPTAPLLLPGSAAPKPDASVAEAAEPPPAVALGEVAEPVPSAPMPEPVPAAPAEEPPSAGVLPVPRRTSLPGGPVSPVRALAGAAVAVAGVLLGIGALLWATDAPSGSPALQQTQAQSSDASPSASPLPSPTPVASASAAAPVVSPAAPSPTPAAAPKLALTVLNNSNVNGLAHRAAAKYRAQGWPIKLEGSFRGRIPVTTVYYAPGQQASAVLLQKEFPAIARVRPRFAGLPGSGLTVVLTRDYPA